MLIDMGDFHVELSRKKIKNINLRINRDGIVKLSAPTRCSLQHIHAYLHTKHDWIKMHRERLVHARTAVVLPVFRTGEQHLFLGEYYPLIIDVAAAAKSYVVMENNQLYMFIHAEASALEKHALLQRWYQEQMTQQLPVLIAKWERIIGVRVQAFRIRAMKTRWGSCHVTQQRICLNLNLIQKPLACLEYVLVHEMVHLLEASHNQRFHALMTQFMPTWPQYKAQLFNDSRLNCILI